jgi:hypothetical protein
MTTTTKKDTLDTFCRLALESDLSDEQLTAYAQLVVKDCETDFTSPGDLVSFFRAMSATEFAQRVKRACNGSATSTDNQHTSIHRETRRAAKV